MNYTLDCEFNGFRGELLSFALYRDDGHSLYCYIAQHKVPCIVKSSQPALRYDGVFAIARQFEPWVAQHVVPHLLHLPDWPQLSHAVSTYERCQEALEEFLHGDPAPKIHVDWPDDIKYFCELLITGPGTMLGVSHIEFEVHRVDSYPTALEGAIQHHAWWDARVLMEYLQRHALI